MKGVETGNGEVAAIKQNDANQWIFYVNGTCNENGSGAGMMLNSPKRHKIHCTLRFGFSESNNEPEYDALITALHLVKSYKPMI